MADDTFPFVEAVLAFLGMIVIVSLGQTLDLPYVARLALAPALGLVLLVARRVPLPPISMMMPSGRSGLTPASDDDGQRQALGS